MRRVPAGTRRGLRALFVLAVLVFFASLGGTAYAADVAPPSMPTGATAATGSAMPIVARVTWIAATDNVGVDGYHVYRAAALAGPYQRIGTSAGASYDDKTGVVGKDYWYEVSAYDAAGNESAQSLPTNPIKAAWTVTPHATFVGTDLCGSCHAPHRALTARNIFRNASSAQGELSTCYACHDGTSASTNIKAGPANSFVLSSGHTMESRIDTTTPADLANSCSDCHSPHKNYLTRPLLWKSQVNTTTVTGADTTWCLSCHNDAQDWYVKKYGSAYPTLTPTLDASGFPIAGTFTGRTIYTSATANAHSTIPTSGSDRVRGDCRYCHATHRGPAKYDALLATLTVPTAATLASDRANGDYAAACFACHGGGAWVASGAVDIKQFATYNGASSVVYSGHRIKSATASAPVDAPLPCFACHNPHGSGRGNNSLITDTLGKSLDTSTAAGNEAVRRFCLSCHATLDNYVWNSNTATYTTVSATETVFGLRRNGGAANSGPGGVGFNYLLLHSVNGHARGDITQACYTCHGRSYAGASANNVHDPGPGVSPGGVSCYACHTTYKANMEDGVGTSVGTARTSSYHHVLGGMLNGGLTYYDGDYAPGGAGAYPNTSFQQVFCVSCHVDHDKFNANKGANLQTSFGSVVATNTDRGLCLSCHGLSFSKDTTNQAGIASSATADVSTLTVTVSPTKYGLSAHDYSVNSSFGASPFNANCVKCHNDEQAKTFQTSKFQFGPHWSGARKLLASWATTVTDPLGEKHCYGCHSRAGQFGTKATNGYDAYGTAGATMTAASEYVWQNFYGSMVSSHPVSTTKLDCVNCHNTHVVRKTATQTVDPDDTYTEYAFGGSTVPSQTAFCLRCHDGAPPVYTLGAAYVPATVTVAISGGNKSAYRLTSHWEASGSVSVAERQSCAVCHDSHGSKLPKLLGAYNGTTTANTINGVAIAANDRTVCYACHANASTGFASPSDDASGYPTDGTWPGAATYTVAYSPANHTGNMHQNATWPAEPALAGGDCKVCHDVHGTANRYDELRDDKVGGIRGVYKYDPSNFSFCFNCHTAGGGSQYNIKGFFPTTASGTLDPVANPRAGHRTLSAGNLPAGSVLPCYDCHNPHGTGPNSPSGLLVVTQVGNNTTTVIGDAPGEIVMTATPAPDSVRKFCFACHTTGDSAPVLTQGWNGSAYATVTAGKVEGIDRTVYNAAGSHLKLPPVSGHYFADTASCYLCHGNDYASPGANNVHNPTGGVSGGASKCYGCHSPYKETMDAAGTSKTTVFHHTLGTGGYTGDLAPGSSNTYPTSSTTVYCVSCHTDHNYFNSNKGSNLRATIANSSGLATASSDFISGGAPSYGICISCHSAALLKDNVNQKSETTSSKTPTITGAAFDISPHDYEATSAFGAAASDQFRANCSKCHSDEQPRSFQTSTRTFGTHYSITRRILAALGFTPVSDPYEEGECYRCHSLTTDAIAGTKKALNGRDWFNLVSMDASSQAIFGLMGKTYRHNVSGYSGVHRPSEDETQGMISANKHVECGDCHNVHAAGPGTHVAGTNSIGATSSIRGVSGEVFTPPVTNWTTPTAAAYSWTTSSTKEYQICFKCHSGANTKVTAWGPSSPATATWTDVALEFSTSNQSYHPVVGPLPVADPGLNGSSQLAANQLWNGWTPGQTMYCSDCHGDGVASPAAQGPHGSAIAHLLKGPNTYWPTNGPNGTGTLYIIGTGSGQPAESTFNGLFCRNCHRISTGAGFFNNVHNEHATAQGGGGAGACISCHTLVPHGGKVSRLMATRTGMPLRYAYQGTLNNVGMTQFIKRAPNGYAKSDCGAVNPTLPGGMSCNTHTAIVGETW